MGAEFECKEHDGVSYVRVRGVIDETFNAKAFLDAINAPRVVLNLSQLNGILDGGKRLWRRTLEHLSDHSEEVLLWDCPSEITEQFSDTPALLALAKVATFLVPYRCTSCKKEIAVRLDAATLSPDDVTSSLCRGCDGKLRVQRNPEILVDLRNHSAFENAALRMRKLVRSMERRFGDVDFEVHTASDLPHAFESTASFVPAGTGETAIEELSPILEETPADEDPTRTPQTEDSEATRPDPTRESTREPSAVTSRAASSERGSSWPKQKRLEPKPSMRAASPTPWPPNLGVDTPSPDAQRVSGGKVRLQPTPKRSQTPIRPVAAAALGGLIVGFAVGFVSNGGGLAEEPVLRFTVSLNDGDFTQAEAVLERSKDKLPEILVELYRQELSRARADAAEVYQRQAIAAFKDRRYDEAASYAQEAMLIEDPEGRMVFLLADALRLDGRKNEALPHYRAFFHEFPEDELADDAMYWRAEALMHLGRHEEAKQLLEGILAMNRSNYKSRAGKLLMELP